MRPTPKIDRRVQAVREALNERQRKPRADVEALKPARSQAELTRVRQGWLLIGLSALNVTLSLILLFTR